MRPGVAEVAGVQPATTPLRELSRAQTYALRAGGHDRDHIYDAAAATPSNVQPRVLGLPLM